MTGILVIIGFIGLLLWGMPIAFALLIPSAIYILATGMPTMMVAHIPTFALDSFPLLAVPLFILVGNLMNGAGITTRIFGFANDLVSHWRGGLAQVNILASLIFSGSSGAALADIGGIGAMEVKAMREAGYPPRFAAALTVASATVGPIFPPSIPLIIYGAVAEVSAVRLLLSGILPALLTVAFLMVFTYVLSVRRKYPRGEGRPPNAEIVRSFWQAFPALLTPVIMIGGMLLGVFTATEAAAVTVAYILFITIFVYRSFNLRHVFTATVDTVKTTSVVIVMVAAAAVFARILALEQVPQNTARLMLSITDDPIVLLLLVNLLVLAAGLFLETISAILLLVPLIAPPLLLVGVDPVHLGVVIVFNLMLGLLTPPMGMSLFLISDVAKVPIQHVFSEVVPYYVPLFAALLIITFVPALTLWIPSLVR